MGTTGRRPRGELTRLGRFMQMNRIQAKALAYIAGLSRQHLLRLRYGKAKPTLDTMLNLRTACSAILCRRVYVSELFFIGEDDLLGAIAFLTDVLVRVEGRAGEKR